MAVELTEDEQHAMQLTTELAQTMYRIVGTEGDCAVGDWNEIAIEIHHIQCRILAQLGSRTDPIYCRPLGGWKNATNTPLPSRFTYPNCGGCGEQIQKLPHECQH